MLNSTNQLKGVCVLYDKLQVMKPKPLSLEKIQQLVSDIQNVERNHFILKTNRHENIAEHSFAVAMLCWRIYDAIKPKLELAKILKYALVHDFSERGYRADVNTFAKKEERERKKKRETLELTKLSDEFKDFNDFVETLNSYENLDDEALFVWSVDKMQAIILGEMDDWRPYEAYGITYKQFQNKGQEFLEKCSPYIKDILKEVFESACKTYYNNPNKKISHFK